MNEGILRAINGWPSALEGPMRFLAEATDYLWVRLALLALIAFLAWRGGKHRLAGLLSLLAFPLADGLTHWLKLTFPLPRPCNELTGLIDHGIGCSNSMGTASAHSANMAAVAVVFTYYLGPWGWPWIAIALATGISRVYHGAHYPGQVLFGWICGILVSGGVIAVQRLIARQRVSVSKGIADEPQHP
jgi:undecaprenyl-diphosphatase